MIQRIQSIFLLGVVVFMGMMFAFPLWEKTDMEAGRRLLLDAYYLYEYQPADAGEDRWEVDTRTPVYYIAVIAGIAALLALYVIFRYDNRVLQIKLNALNAFLIMASIAVSALFIYNGEMALGEDRRGIFEVGFFMPVGALLCISLANRFIKKDEDLVRSVDRIR